MSLTGKKFRNFLPLPFAQETSLFSAFLHGFNNGTKNSSIVGGAIGDTTRRTFFGISIDGGRVNRCVPWAVLSRTARELARKSFQITVAVD